MLNVILIALGLASSSSSVEESCPLPTQSNVSYQSVTELAVRAPNDVIAYGEAALQFGELWLPAKEQYVDETAPTIALIHGGCWLNAYDIQHSRALSGALADAGYVVWSLEYRRTGDEGGGWPGTLEDVIQGLNFIKELKFKEINTNSLAIIGHSAGGHLALLAGNDNRLTLKPKLILGLAPVVDIEIYARGSNSCQTVVPRFMGGRIAEIPTAYKQANPAKKQHKYNSRSVHGELDAIVPLAQSTENLPTQVVKGAGHFDFIHPQTPAYRAILRELAEAL